MIKEKVLSFMEAHPKATSAVVGTMVTLGGSAAMLAPGLGIVASADDPSQASVGDAVNTISTSAISETLVNTAHGAFNTAVQDIVPVLASVIGFNVIVRLVRRFVKG